MGLGVHVTVPDFRAVLLLLKESEVVALLSKVLDVVQATNHSVVSDVLLLVLVGVQEGADNFGVGGLLVTVGKLSNTNDDGLSTQARLCPVMFDLHGETSAHEGGASRGSALTDESRGGLMGGVAQDMGVGFPSIPLDVNVVHHLPGQNFLRVPRLIGGPHPIHDGVTKTECLAVVGFVHVPGGDVTTSQGIGLGGPGLTQVGLENIIRSTGHAGGIRIKRLARGHVKRHTFFLSLILPVNFSNPK
jgi:hypothetical protein